MQEKRDMGVLDILVILSLYLPFIHVLYAKSAIPGEGYYNTTFYYVFMQYVPILIYIVDTIILLKTKRFKRWSKRAKAVTIIGYIVCLPSFIFSIVISMWSIAMLLGY